MKGTITWYDITKDKPPVSETNDFSKSQEWSDTIFLVLECTHPK